MNLQSRHLAPRGLRAVLGPLYLPLLYIVCGLVMLSLFRGVLTWTYRDRLSGVPNLWMVFVVGIRMDLVLLSYFTIAPVTMLLLLPGRIVQRVRHVIAGWCGFSFALIVYMEIATFPFLAEFDVRPDQKYLEYLAHVQEVSTMLLKVYPWELVIGTVALVGCCVATWRLALRVLTQAPQWSLARRLMVAPVVLALLVLGARSSIGRRPANISTACFSSNNLANEMGLNSTYSMLYAAYRMLRHEKNPSLDYGRMDTSEVLERVAEKSHFEGGIIPGEIPFLHKQDSPFDGARPLNVVIFLQESLSASSVGCLGGPPITPHLCRLKDEGLWLSNLYATGTRTVRGIEATVSGFLPTSTVGVVKLSRARKNFVTIASILQRAGYSTNFFYGGMGHFDQMKSFFLGNGFQHIYDQPTFESPAFLGTWGVSDEDLVRKANEVFVSHGDKPFFGLLLSTSNHLPYEFPDGRIELYEQPKQTPANAIKYADYAIGLFFELAKKENYFKNTLFLIVADHNAHVRGNDLVPIGKFHIPGLILGPNVPRQEMNVLASQVDLVPTLLHFSGLDTVHPMIGRNLMSLPPGDPGRAFMQFASNNAYRVGDQVIVQRPFLPPAQFSYLPQEDRLVETALDPEFAKDALAYAHLPWLLYAGEDYRLPQ